MKVITRLLNLGKYLAGDFIIIDVHKELTIIDAGIADTKSQHKAAVDFFHDVYTKKP